MDIRHLTSYCVLAEELHFGRAAERLHIVQSALTTQIRQVEENLGTKLFTRNRNAPVQLTQAGELFLVEAKKVLNQFDHAKAVGLRAGRGEIGKIKIGYVASALYAGVLGHIVHQFHRNHPDVEITFHELETPRQIEAVLSGEVDVGFARSRRFPNEIAPMDIATEPLVLAMRKDHTLPVKNGRIAPSALVNSRFVVTLSEREPGLYANVLEVGRAGAFTPDIAFHVQTLTSLLAVVASGLAVAVVPTSLQTVRLPDVVYAKIATKPLIERLILIRSRTNNSSAVDRFCQHAQKRKQTPVA